MTFREVLACCVDRWRAEGIPLLPPIGEAEVRAVWGRLGQRVSDDVLLFYSMVGGFGGEESDEEFFWCLWPWSRLRERNAEYPGGGVQFCDHSIQVVTWELRFEDERHSSVWTTEGEVRTAPTLESFLRMYLDDPWQLLQSCEDNAACSRTHPTRDSLTLRCSGPGHPGAL